MILSCWTWSAPITVHQVFSTSIHINTLFFSQRERERQREREKDRERERDWPLNLKSPRTSWSVTGEVVLFGASTGSVAARPGTGIIVTFINLGGKSYSLLEHCKTWWQPAFSKQNTIDQTHKNANCSKLFFCNYWYLPLHWHIQVWWWYSWPIHF